MAELSVWPVENRKVVDLVPHERNPRKISPEKFAKLKERIISQGFRTPVCIDNDGTLLAGHQRCKALIDMGLGDMEIPVSIPPVELTKEMRDEILVSDNLSFGEFDYEMLLEDFNIDELGDFGFDTDIFDGLMETNEPEMYADGEKGGMQANFIAPPFSILDAKQGYWKDRKKYWLGLGIKSELGRDDKLIDYGDIGTGDDGDTSIFDPVLCEIIYTWFSQKGNTVLDCFAGGSVRGVVASKLGRQYIGVDLRGEQIKANQAQGETLCEDPIPVWHQGDSRNIQSICKGVKADLLMSCPPYADLEVYSDDKKDLSNMAYAEFLEAYREIIHNSFELLNDDSFAVFVVGEVRGKDGNYYNFVGDTVQAFIDAGFNYYNEAILATSIGSLPLRAGKSFKTSRKLGKAHQNVLVFVKGDGKKPAKKCGDVEIMQESDE